jgi:hypothetical protein
MHKTGWAIALSLSLLLPGFTVSANAQDNSPPETPATPETTEESEPSEEPSEDRIRLIECNRLITISNQAVDEVQAVTQSENRSNPESLVSIANIADRASAAMKIIELTDDQLEAFRQRFIAMYTGTSQAVRNLEAASRVTDSTAAQEAYNSLIEATTQEEPLVNEVNAYCNSAVGQDSLQRPE